MFNNAGWTDAWSMDHCIVTSNMQVRRWTLALTNEKRSFPATEVQGSSAPQHQLLMISSTMS